MSTKLKTLLATAALIIGGATAAIAEDVRPSDLYTMVQTGPSPQVTLQTGPSAQLTYSVSPKPLLKYDSIPPRTEDFIDSRTKF
jgi:hypothetical protein